MNKFSIDNKIGHTTFSKVIKFGGDLFSPVIPPSSCLETINNKLNISTAINPQDIVLAQNQTTRIAVTAVTGMDYEKEEEEKENTPRTIYAISPTGYFETVRSPYSAKLGHTLFDTSRDDDYPMFSIDCSSDSNIPTNNSSSNNSSSSNSSNSTMSDNTTSELLLPPSSAILQSELNKSSLEYFITNNSFLEEINSGLTNLSHLLQPCTTATNNNNNNSQQFDISHSLLQQQNTSFFELFPKIDEDALLTSTCQSEEEEEEELEINTASNKQQQKEGSVLSIVDLFTTTKKDVSILDKQKKTPQMKITRKMLNHHLLPIIKSSKLRQRRVSKEKKKTKRKKKKRLCLPLMKIKRGEMMKVMILQLLQRKPGQIMAKTLSIYLWIGF